MGTLVVFNGRKFMESLKMPFMVEE